MVSHPQPGDTRHTTAQIDFVRHDVTNALTVIRGYAHSLQRRLQRPDVVPAHDLPDMLAQLASIDAAVSDVLAAMGKLDNPSPGQDGGDGA